MSDKIQLGYTSLNEEITVANLPVTGSIPAWLTGALYRNTPAKYELGQYKYNHMFDGFAMINKFGFHNGQVSYANRFLRSSSYNFAQETGVLLPGYSDVTYTGPGTAPVVPAVSQLGPRIPNASVSIVPVNGRLVALTEVPGAVEFNRENLDTVGLFKFEQEVPGQMSTAHPHYDFDYNQLISHTTNFGRTTSYNVYRVTTGSTRQALIASVPVPEAAYMHSFAVTKNYVILVEFPDLLNPLELMQTQRPVYRWKPEVGTRFVVISKQSGEVVGTYQGEAFMCYHHVNAFEQGDELCIDVVAYPAATAYDNLIMSKLQSKQANDATGEGKLQRCRLPLQGSYVDYELLTEAILEFPQINYRQRNGHAYQFVYGVGNSHTATSQGPEVLKIDIKQGITKVWFAPDCFPAEPIFVPKPGATSEDEGVVLTVLLDGQKGNSFLLVLDGVTFEELGRAMAPHHIPFGFHGIYAR